MIKKSLASLLILKLSLFSCADYWNPNSIEFMLLEKRDNVFLQYGEDLDNASIYDSILYNYNEKNKEANLLEWQKVLKNDYKEEFSTKEIEEILYENKNLNSVNSKEIKEYFSFTKEQEACVNFDNYGYLEKPKNCKTYINKALEKLENINNSFLKERYFFLALRLAHYEKENPLEIYNKYSEEFKNSNSLANSWIKAIYAGALIKDGKKAEGVYEFLTLFDESINYHLALYNFFHIRNEKDFNKLLELSKNSDEKEKAYVLRALDSSSSSIEEIENIANLNKDSKWIDFLLYRELLKSLSNLNDFYYYEDEWYGNEKFNSRYLQFLEDFRDLNRNDNYLIDLSLLYFGVYTLNFEIANEALENLEKTNKNSHEVDIASYFLFLNQIDILNIDKENEIMERLNTLLDENHNSDSLIKYTFKIVEKLYKKQNQEFDEFLVKNIISFSPSGLSVENIALLNNFINSNQESQFKKYLQNRYKKELENNIDELNYVKLVNLINNLNFQEALDLNIAELNKKLEFNPFNALIRGNNRSGTKEQYTIKEFLKKAILIEKNAKKDLNNYMDNFLYANILYNLSYFGNSDRITTIYRSSYSIHTPKLQEEKLNLALKYYQIALNSAKNKEQKAKISYQITKTKLALFDLTSKAAPQNISWWNKEKRTWNYGSRDDFYEIFLIDSGARDFNKLRDDFSDTKYYNELLKECGDFRTYINMNKKR